MFAYVQFTYDKKLAKVPITFIKKFNPEEFDSQRPYKVYWSRLIQSLQIEDPSNNARLEELQEPPSSESWNESEGEGYWPAHILRLKESLNELIKSLRKKRPILPTYHANKYDSVSTTEEESGSYEVEKAIRKKQEAEIKKVKELRKIKGDKILKIAKKTRMETFKQLNIDNDSGEENVPEMITVTTLKALKSSYKKLEREKEAIENKYSDLNDEVVELRKLNRQLQEELLNGARTVVSENEGNPIPSENDSDTTEVDLGAGIKINKKLYNSITSENTVKKFTKNLAVAVWGTTVLSGRSVTGRPCRNKNGPKKVDKSQSCCENDPQPQPKPPLTPEKLAVISDQMRKYLVKAGKTPSEIEGELKLRNKHISDKIQDVCSNVARQELKAKFTK